MPYYHDPEILENIAELIKQGQLTGEYAGYKWEIKLKK